MDDLSHRDITYCKGVGPNRADILRKEINVLTAMDIIRYYPFKYIDRRHVYKIAHIRGDEENYIQIKGMLLKWETFGGEHNKRLVATFTDGSNTVELVWFKKIQFIKLEKGIQYLLFGKPSYFDHRLTFVHPELTPIALVKEETLQGLEPYYNTTDQMKKKGMSSKVIREIIRPLAQEARKGIRETIGQDVIDDNKLMGLGTALYYIHFPPDEKMLHEAQKRLKFEELFYIQLQLLRSLKKHACQRGYPMPIVGKSFKYFYFHCLPFELTQAQKRVVKEIQGDIRSGFQMNRLLQGDVGSGKTLVALLSMLLAIDNGYQSCIMVPTEILANQHFNTIKDLLKDTPVRIDILTGSTTKKARIPLFEAIKDGSTNILVGTHALIEDDVVFHNLGLCIIDEQHRFGVVQRSKLWNKNANPPHVLVMTATPIPRTLAMTLYGDLKISVIDQLPPGRKPVKTLHYTFARKREINQFIRLEVEKGHQVYIVFPLIEESEKMDLKNLHDGYSDIVETFPDYQIAMVHGKMKNADKELQMSRFVSGEAQILVATTVIEVGVNVPNASTMIIENAERFGLSQLHQLRGRVGRGNEQSFCLLVTDVELSSQTRERIDTMVASNDGFRIAEVDMELRGYGDIEGTQQSGIPINLSIANLATDGGLLENARMVAQDILDKDPELSSSWNKIYKEQLNILRQSPQNWSDIS